MPRITPTLIATHPGSFTALSERSTRGVSSERLRLRGIRTDTPSAQLHTRAACVAGPCHIALGVAAPHSVCHRARSPAPVLVVSPMPICAVARARAARCSPPLPPARPCHVPWLAHVSPAPPSASAQLGAQLGAHRLEASGAPHEISASSALSSAPIASKPA